MIFVSLSILGLYARTTDFHPDFRYSIRLGGKRGTGDTVDITIPTQNGDAASPDKTIIFTDVPVIASDNDDLVMSANLSVSGMRRLEIDPASSTKYRLITFDDLVKLTSFDRKAEAASAAPTTIHAAVSRLEEKLARIQDRQSELGAPAPSDDDTIGSLSDVDELDAPDDKGDSDA